MKEKEEVTEWDLTPDEINELEHIEAINKGRFALIDYICACLSIAKNSEIELGNRIRKRLSIDENLAILIDHKTGKVWRKES